MVPIFSGLILISGLNKKSVFTNLGGSKTVSENTNIGDTVFQVSYYDADGDTANFTPTYAPAACSSLFAVGTSGMFNNSISFLFFS